MAPAYFRRIDMVCSLEKGLIGNRLTSGKSSALPGPGSLLVVDTSDNRLLKFYGLMSPIISQANLPIFDFAHYLQRATRPEDEETVAHVGEAHKLTIADVEAARSEVEQMEARIQAEGEDAVRQDIWDQAVDAMAGLPEVEQLSAQLAALTGRVHREWDPEQDAVHQAVVRFIQDLQEIAARYHEQESGSERHP